WNRRATDAFKAECAASNSHWLSQTAFEDRRGPLPLADAQRGEPVPHPLVAHAVQEGGGAARPAAAKRMADRDRSAARIHPALVDPQQLEHREDLDGKGLVDFDRADIL